MSSQNSNNNMSNNVQARGSRLTQQQVRAHIIQYRNRFRKKDRVCFKTKFWKWLEKNPFAENIIKKLRRLSKTPPMEWQQELEEEILQRALGTYRKPRDPREGTNIEEIISRTARRIISSGLFMEATRDESLAIGRIYRRRKALRDFIRNLRIARVPGLLYF